MDLCAPAANLGNIENVASSLNINHSAPGGTRITLNEQIGGHSVVVWAKGVVCALARCQLAPRPKEDASELLWNQSYVSLGAVRQPSSDALDILARDGIGFSFHLRVFRVRGRKYLLTVS